MTDSRTGENPKYVWQADLPWEATHKHRPVRGKKQPRQNSCLQTELMEAILSSSNLEAAYHRVKSNGGAGGVDGVTLLSFREWYQPRREGLMRRLRIGSYLPDPVRRIYIEKENNKLRPIGIPTVFDRVIQQAMNQILTQVFDHSFSEHSYGFRPERGAHGAIRAVQAAAKAGYRWVVDIDLQSFFDTVPQARALQLLRERLGGSGPVVNLIKAYLKSGYIEKDTFHSTVEGVPQGGPLSPLLSNLVLDELDRELEKRGLRFPLSSQRPTTTNFKCGLTLLL